jgi:dolichol-phosphate mannosyltransferase
MTNLGIVLATYNEAANLPQLIEGLEQVTSDALIIVVDDNSPDGTSAVAHELAERYGNIHVVTRPSKQGIGTAVRDGISRALDLGCKYVLTMDADLSHRPEDAVRLIEEAYLGTADLVQGSRHIDGGRTEGWTTLRRLQSRIANGLYVMLLGTPRDVTNNFRIFTRTSALLIVKEAQNSGYESCPEYVLIAMRHNLTITEVPITSMPRGAGTSKLNFSQYINSLRFLISAFISFRLGLGRFAKVAQGQRNN